jgi:hypothetical protein
VAVPRRPADVRSERRVERLVALLFQQDGRDDQSIAEIARGAGLEHETVRRLRRNPGGRNRSGPGFFIVAAIARTRGISLDRLAELTLADEPIGRDA